MRPMHLIQTLLVTVLDILLMMQQIQTSLGIRLDTIMHQADSLVVLAL